MNSRRSKKHHRYGIDVSADRHISVNGPVADRLPCWGAMRGADHIEMQLVPAVSYEVHYRLPVWVAVFAFNSAETRAALADQPLATGVRARGSACLIPPHTRVRVIQEQPQEFLGVTISPERLASVADAELGQGRWRSASVYSESDPALSALCNELRRVMISEPNASRSYVETIVEAAASRLVGSGLGVESGQDPTPDGRESLAPAIKRRIAAEINGRLGEKITVAALAETAGLSRSHFTRAFAASFGESPARYLLQRRIARARGLLLETQRPVTEIALSCGFTDHAHFSTVFRKEIGLAPSAYRKTAAERDAPVTSRRSGRDADHG